MDASRGALEALKEARFRPLDVVVTDAARPVSGALFNPKADYLLRVSGLSMRDAGILDGDLLAVHATPKANNGDLVVARIDGEVTVKRFQRKGNKVTLLAANPDFAPIEIDPRKQEFVIEGLGVGVISSLG